jgi:hypothetical protein
VEDWADGSSKNSVKVQKIQLKSSKNSVSFTTTI